MTITKLLVDADVITYRAAGAVKRHTDPETGALVADEPVEAALGNCKSIIRRILGRFNFELAHQLYLTGSGNFRDARATIQPYKGNRDRTKRPPYYRETREYLLSQWNATLIDGREADDALGCEQWSAKDRSTCIVTNDKDLRMIPGWHYHFVKEELSYITLREANRNFYLQMLSGDVTDHIRGCPGIGVVRAGRILMDCGSDCAAYSRAVQQEYKKAYGDKWQDALLEHADLLWIEREEGMRCPLPLL